MLWDLAPTQRELADYMGDLSEKAYCVGWESNLEYDLWKAVVSGPYQYGRLFFDATIILRLLHLSDEIGGWIVFHDDWEETFVPTETWRWIYINQNRDIHLSR